MEKTCVVRRAGFVDKMCSIVGKVVVISVLLCTTFDKVLADSLYCQFTCKGALRSATIDCLSVSKSLATCDNVKHKDDNCRLLDSKPYSSQISCEGSKHEEEKWCYNGVENECYQVTTDTLNGDKCPNGYTQGVPFASQTECTFYMKRESPTKVCMYELINNSTKEVSFECRDEKRTACSPFDVTYTGLTVGRAYAYGSLEECEIAKKTKKEDLTKKAYCSCLTAKGDHYTCLETTVAKGCTADCRGPYDTSDECKKHLGSVDRDPGSGSKPINVDLNTQKLTHGALEKMNPLRNAKTEDGAFGDPANRTPGNVVTRLLKNILFPLGGLLLFLMIVLGGFQIVSGSTMGNNSTVESGKRRIMAATVGFLLLFASYWMWTLVEYALSFGTTS